METLHQNIIVLVGSYLFSLWSPVSNNRDKGLTT